MSTLAVGTPVTPATDWPVRITQWGIGCGGAQAIATDILLRAEPRAVVVTGDLEGWLARLPGAVKAHGGAKRRAKAWADAVVVVTTYATLKADLAAGRTGALDACPTLLVLDAPPHRATAITKALAKLCAQAHRCVVLTERAWASDPLGAWALVRLVAPSLAGTKADFLATHLAERDAFGTPRRWRNLTAFWDRVTPIWEVHTKLDGALAASLPAWSVAPVQLVTPSHAEQAMADALAGVLGKGAAPGARRLLERVLARFWVHPATLLGGTDPISRGVAQVAGENLASMRGCVLGAALEWAAPSLADGLCVALAAPLAPEILGNAGVVAGAARERGWHPVAASAALCAPLGGAGLVLVPPQLSGAPETVWAARCAYVAVLGPGTVVPWAAALPVNVAGFAAKGCTSG